MSCLVCAGASMMCTMGMAPSTLVVLPQNHVFAPMPIANIMDNKSMMNIPPFGMCTSLANPSVASATTAAAGVLTPMPCTPVTPTPWAPGAAKALVGNMPALDQISKLACTWGGMISILSPGQTIAST